ncbi:MAG TPA: GGDEF domain-containing protein, partial [Methylibium sp.]
AGQPADALACADAALDALESFPPGHPLRPLAQAQAGLARVLIGHIAAGRLEVEAALQAADAGYYANGPDGHSLLRQLDETLSRAGDAVGALEVYHREQGLREQRQRHDKEVALKDLQISYDSERKQREIDLLNRDNSLKAAAVEASELRQRLLWLAAVVLGLGLLLAVLLHWRLRALRLDLAQRQTQLRRQSERDALTGLANRRHFEDRMAELLEARAPGAGDGYEGALFMLDIDQFKRVNERLGHAGGDAVLAEVAARIAGTVRSKDIAARWGGEEFVVAAPSLPAAQAEGLAERLLRAVGDHPVDVADTSLTVTVSIGYAHFPLPPHQPALPWERALNLVDLALYVAKHRGRDRALGVTALHALDEASLQAVEAEFEPAWQDGRVHLHVLQRAAPTAENKPS